MSNFAGVPLLVLYSFVMLCSQSGCGSEPTQSRTASKTTGEVPSQPPKLDSTKQGEGASTQSTTAKGTDAPAEKTEPPATNPPATNSEQPATSAEHPAAKTEQAPPVQPKYEFRELHDPNGIGKFYMDREIAHVMGFAGAIWLERPEREDEEAPSKLVKALQLKPGQTIADIGAGSGILSVMMAKEVGPTGKVLAVDVQQEMLDLLEKKLTKLKVTNVEGRLGTEKSPQLKPDSIDLAIMVDVYHEFAFPFEMMFEISKSLKPGGRVVFVEYRKEDPDVPIKLVHKMTEAQVKREIGLPELGLKWKETIGVLPRQHIIIFEKPAGAAVEKPANQNPAK